MGPTAPNFGLKGNSGTCLRHLFLFVGSSACVGWGCPVRPGRTRKTLEEPAKGIDQPPHEGSPIIVCDRLSLPLFSVNTLFEQ